MGGTIGGEGQTTLIYPATGLSSGKPFFSRALLNVQLPMRARIQDEFTNLNLSRQRKYQLRMQRDKRCTECGEPAPVGSRCLKHLIHARERQRKKRGLKRRYLNTLSYKLETMAA